MNAARVLELARAKGWHIATAESCTGGLLAGALTEVAGSSDVFDRGFVTYSNKAKQDMLGVFSDTLEGFGAVSEEVAIEMAEGALGYAAVEIGLSITGIAGPGGSDHKPEGRVCFALAAKDRQTLAQTVEFGAIGRAKVRRLAVEHALKLLGEALSA